MEQTEHWRLLYNQDPGILFSHTEEPITPEHVDGAVDQVAAAGVDVFLVNPNMWRTNYPSQVWETWWDGFHHWAAVYPPMETPEVLARRHWHHPQHPLRHHMIRQMERLHQQGCDYLERSLRRCRHHGLVAGVSIRMNDGHDRAFPESHYWSQWYRLHPDLQIQWDPDRGVAPLDYRHQAVRDHMYLLIEEIVTGYAVELLELDFLRHARFFKEPFAAVQVPTMTGFVRRVSELCRTKGVELVPRVPVTPAASLELGLDPARWAQEGLVDGIIISPVMCAQWQAPVVDWRRRVPDDVALYVGSDKTADQKEGFPLRRIHSEPDLLRGFAASYVPYADVCDGLYFFNFFGPRAAVTDPHEPAWEVLPELKRAARLSGRPKTYLTTAADRGLGAATDGPLQVPVDLPYRFGRLFQLTVMEEPDAAAVIMELRVIYDGDAAADDLWLQANQVPLGRAAAGEAYQQPAYRNMPARRARTAVFLLPRDVVSGGINDFVVRRETEKACRVLGLEVHVRPAGEPL